MKNKQYSKVPVFENGLAQPVFPFTDGKTGENYDPSTSDIVRYCVYVESDYDMDGDGKRDLIKVLVQVPRSAVEGNYKAASLFKTDAWVLKCISKFNLFSFTISIIKGSLKIIASTFISASFFKYSLSPFTSSL